MLQAWLSVGYIVLIAILLVAAALRIHRLNEKSFWFDEFESVAMADFQIVTFASAKPETAAETPTAIFSSRTRIWSRRLLARPPDQVLHCHLLLPQWVVLLQVCVMLNLHP